MNKKIPAVQYIAGQPHETLESLAREEALQIQINGKPYTITMRTPGHDRFLAVGLLFTERVIRNHEDIIRVSEIPAPSGTHTLVINVEIKEEILAGKNLFNRSIASSASCGVCGKIELCDLITPGEPISTAKRLDIDMIPDLLEQMHDNQRTFEETGGSHAAAVFTIEGKLLSIHEDIGRHNAVDKALGDLLLRNCLANASILFVSGRVSYEIVAKCAEASIPFLLAISAPSSLAVDFCRSKGISLVGFCRENRATMYTNENNIQQHEIRQTVMSANINGDKL